MKKLEIVEIKGKRVLTTRQIAEAYGTAPKHIQGNRDAKIKLYQEGVCPLFLLSQITFLYTFCTRFLQFPSICQQKHIALNVEKWTFIYINK